jgi:spore maturation protein CgeB
MRILYAVHNHGPEDVNFLEGLRQAGHEVVVHRPGHAFREAIGPDWTEADRERVSQRLVEAVRAEHARQPIDVFFGYLIKQFVYPEAIREIGELGITTLNYWCNGAHQFYLVDEISPAFDYCVVTERASLPLYRELGARPIYSQMGANPEVYRPYDVPHDYDVTFVGQRYADRPEYIYFLLRNGVDVHVWGAGWTRDRTYGEKPVGIGVTPRYLVRHPRSAAKKLASFAARRVEDLVVLPPHARRRLARASGPSLPYDELVRMYSRSRISLGFSTCGDARYRDEHKIRQVHMRDFEAPMSGALYFVEYQEELEEFYELEREIVCYRSREELLDKVRYYLANPEEATRVRRAGYERAQRDHTWKRRFDQLFQELERNAGVGASQARS